MYFLGSEPQLDQWNFLLSKHALNSTLATQSYQSLTRPLYAGGLGEVKGYWSPCPGVSPTVMSQEYGGRLGFGRCHVPTCPASQVWSAHPGAFLGARGGQLPWVQIQWGYVHNNPFALPFIKPFPFFLFSPLLIWPLPNWRLSESWGGRGQPLQPSEGLKTLLPVC